MNIDYSIRKRGKTVFSLVAAASIGAASTYYLMSSPVNTQYRSNGTQQPPLASEVEPKKNQDFVNADIDLNDAQLETILKKLGHLETVITSLSTQSISCEPVIGNPLTRSQKADIQLSETSRSILYQLEQQPEITAVDNERIQAHLNSLEPAERGRFFSAAVRATAGISEY